MGSVDVAALAGELEDVGEGGGGTRAAALLAHAPVARNQVGQPKHDAQPDHHKQRHQPLRAAKPDITWPLGMAEQLCPPDGSMSLASCPEVLLHLYSL